MKIKRTTTWWLALLMISAASWTDAAEIDVYFSPCGGLARAIATEIDAAKTSVDVMIFTISNPQIVQALRRAHERGIQVRVIVNPAQEKSRVSKAGYLHSLGLRVRSDDRHTRMHNKVTIIDSMIVCTGSANYSKSADRSNAENLVIIRDTDVARKFLQNFLIHWNHSRVFQQPPKKAKPFPFSDSLPHYQRNCSREKEN